MKIPFEACNENEKWLTGIKKKEYNGEKGSIYLCNKVKGVILWLVFF